MLTINLVTRSYDQLMPLACGDVVAEGIDLRLDRKTPIQAFMSDPAYQAGEMSFSQYLIRTSQGERDYVGLPLFVMRGFRQRCFFVLRDSGLRSLQDLAGRRVGTNGWPDSGNTWSRAALREQGVGIDQIEWWVGPADDPAYDSQGHRPRLSLPANVQYAAEGRTLQDMLLGGELDAMMCPWPPKAFYAAGSQIVRLIPDYRQAEQDYARRVGFYPAHHIIALRRQVVEQDPWVVPSLYQAFERSRAQARENRRFLADTTPWLLADMDDAAELLGTGWQANGVEPNLPMIETMCQEEFAQGLIAQPLEARALFAAFESIMAQVS